MMLTLNFRRLVLVSLIGFAFAAESFAVDGDSRPLLLAKNGETRYVIVVAADAHDAEVLAAEELALFLGKMTSATFPIRRDDVSRTSHEIVIGHTNRLAVEQIPTALRSDNFEGFALIRDDERLLIMGNIPRGTLYGVYDFLDVELGVRFLANKVNHVPKRPTLEAPVTSRVYGPPLERRTIWQANPMGDTILRNRMNGIGFQVANEKMLGGVKMIGRPTHTYQVFVNPTDYFDDHPEYFAFIDGKRRARYRGLVTQLCLTNPDVLRISKEVVHKWLSDASQSNPYNKYLVSVSANDSQGFCQCESCAAVNREEGVGIDVEPAGIYGGGTHVRFVNAIAAMVARDFPHASVKTMFYHMKLPKKTPLASNVILEAGSSTNWYYPMDDMSRPSSHRMKKWLERWKNSAGNGYLYIWTKHVHFGNYFHPRANLRWIARNIGVMARDYNLRGQFAQNVQTPGAHLQTLRYYLLARAMWRPTNDSRDEIKEFCRLYYGDASDEVLEYINFIHDEYLAYIDGVPEDDHAFWDRGRSRVDKENYIRVANEILARAAARVTGPEMTLRVETLRLPAWRMMVDLYEQDHEDDPDLIPSEAVREAGRRFIEIGRAVRLTHLWETYDGPNARTERSYYRRIREMWRRGIPVDPADPWISDDEGLAAADLAAARRLDLCGSKVTDAGLAHLRHASQLRELDLRFTHVTDEGLGHLAGLVHLTELHLGGNAHNVGKKITDRTIHQLARMRGLTKLSLSYTKISNDAVQIIKEMPGLTHLDLHATGVNDEGLKELAKALPDLRHLVLSTARVTDVGLAHLQRLENLRYLNLWDATEVTGEGIEALQLATPGLHVRQY